MSETVTIKLEDKAGRAPPPTGGTHRSVDDLVNQAILDHLELQEWQRQKIEARIAAADRYEFAAEEELA
jgi:predicted transcriptional regulator